MTYNELIHKFRLSHIEELATPHDYNLREQNIRAAASAVIKFESANQIVDARQLLAQEREIQERLAEFKKLEGFFQRSDSEEQLVEDLVSGAVHSEKLTDEIAKIDLFSNELRVIKSVLEKLDVSLAHVQKQKKILPKQTVIDASTPDPFSAGDRREFERGI